MSTNDVRVIRSSGINKAVLQCYGRADIHAVISSRSAFLCFCLRHVNIVNGEDGAIANVRPIKFRTAEIVSEQESGREDTSGREDSSTRTHDASGTSWNGLGRWPAPPWQGMRERESRNWRNWRAKNCWVRCQQQQREHQWPTMDRDLTFWLILLLSFSLSETLSWTLKSGFLKLKS